MPTKTYILVASRSTQARAEKLKKHIESFGMISARIVPKKLGSPTALVPTVYEVWVKPSRIGSIYVGTVGSKAFAAYLRVVQYGKDGEVI